MKKKTSILTASAVLLLSASSAAYGQVDPVAAEQREKQMVQAQKNAAQNNRNLAAMIKQSLQDLALMEDQLTAAQNMADNIDKAYRVYDALFVGGDQIRALYYESQGLLTDLKLLQQEYARLAESGHISFRELSRAYDTIDYVARDGAETYRYLVEDVFKDGIKMDIKSRLDLLNQAVEKIRSLRKRVDADLDDKVQAVVDSVTALTFAQLVSTAYGAGDVVLAEGKVLEVPDVDEIVSRYMPAEDGTAAEAAEKAGREIRGSGNHAMRDFLLAVIGVLFVVMAIPAFLRVQSGEAQSRNAIYKLLAGTFGVVMAVFLLDAINFF